MKICAHCDKRATTEDAMGLPACAEHEHEADEYLDRYVVEPEPLRS